MFCRQCGYNNDKYASVCRRCGSVLRDIGNYAPDAPEEEVSTNEEIIDEMLSRGSGQLKLEKKKEPLLVALKKRFKKLEYASDNTKKWLIAACIAGALVICLAAFGIVRLAVSCSNSAADIYASDSSSIAADTCAVIDERGEWIYFTKMYGENPGLFKVSAEGGEELKLSYRRLTQMLLTDEWIYGTDSDDGCLWRVPTGGGAAQLVTEDTVEDVNIVNDDLYYIGSDGCIYQSSLRRVDEETAVTAKKLSEKQAMCLTVYNDKIYFIEPDSVDTTTTTTMPVVSNSSMPFFGAAEDEKKLVSPFENTVYGTIFTMNTDGSGIKAFGSEKAAYMTVQGDNIYYAVGTTVPVSTGDVNLITGEPEVVDYAALQMRRRSIKGGSSVNFNEPGVAGGFLNFTSSGVYFVSAENGLLRCSLKGDETSYVYTGESDIDSVSVVGKWLYYWANDNTRYCRVPLAGGTVEVICEKEAWQ